MEKRALNLRRQKFLVNLKCSLISEKAVARPIVLAIIPTASEMCFMRDWKCESGR